MSRASVEFRELCRCAQNLRGDIVFYDKFAQLCKQRGVSPSKAAVDAGISKSLVTKWRVNNIQVPSPEVLQKVSAYFSVPISDLLEEKKLFITQDEELDEYLEMLRTRPECRVLFSLTKDATKTDVEKAVAIIEALRNTEKKGL